MTIADRWLLPDGMDEVLPPQATRMEALRRALPGQPSPLDPDHASLADLLWSRLLEFNWIEPAGAGRGVLTTPPPTARSLGDGFDAAKVAEGARLLAKISQHIRPVERAAIFGPRVVAREGWLKLTPDSGFDDTPAPPLIS